MPRLECLLVAAVGALGSVARYGETFPLGTLLVNVSGYLVLGFFDTLTGVEGRVSVGPEWRIAFMSGVCGEITTSPPSASRR